MLQIWLLYDFHFLVCAYIVFEPYVPTYGLSTIYEISQAHLQICRLLGLQ